MNDPRETGPEKQFEAAWRAWLDQPMRQQPAPGWLAGEPGQKSWRRRRFWRPLAAVAALATVLAAALVMKQGPPLPEVAGTGVESPTLGQGEVLIWLDDRTPLYMTFQTQ